MQGLGDLSGGIFQSSAERASADGSVIVGSSESANGTEAFRWTSGGGMMGLGDFAGSTFGSLALGVSADGSVVVGAGTSVNGFEAFRWTSGSGLVGLGDLTGGVFNSVAMNVSADGSVIVGSASTASGSEAFIWTEAMGMQSIRQLLINQGLNMTGWSLQTAWSISADGTTIIGTGTNPSGDSEAWIASVAAVPEVNTVVMFATAVSLGLFMYWKQCRRDIQLNDGRI